MKVTLTEWAHMNFSPSPSISTLRMWAKTGQISPTPVKVGRTWMCDENAEYTPLETHPADGMSSRALEILNGTRT